MRHFLTEKSLFSQTNFLVISVLAARLLFHIQWWCHCHRAEAMRFPWSSNWYVLSVQELVGALCLGSQVISGDLSSKCRKYIHVLMRVPDSLAETCLLRFARKRTCNATVSMAVPFLLPHTTCLTLDTQVVTTRLASGDVRLRSPAADAYTQPFSVMVHWDICGYLSRSTIPVLSEEFIFSTAELWPQFGNKASNAYTMFPLTPLMDRCFS